MSNLVATLSNTSLVLTSPSVSGSIVTSATNNPAASIGSAGYESFVAVGTSPTNIPLPVPRVFVVYIRNIGSTNNLLITLTPQGGSAWVSPAILQPGGVFALVPNYTSTPSVGGFSALTLAADAGSTNTEIFLGG